MIQNYLPIQDRFLFFIKYIGLDEKKKGNIAHVAGIAPRGILPTPELICLTLLTGCLSHVVSTRISHFSVWFQEIGHA